MSASESQGRKQLNRGHVQTLLYGNGKPRLRLGAAVFGALWAALIWLIYPYALSVAAWDTNVRYLGLLLLLVVAFAVYKLLRNLWLLLWHLGLLWLCTILLALFVGATVARGRAAGVADWDGWRQVAGQVAADLQARAGSVLGSVTNVPSEAFMAATGTAPFWRPPPSAYVEPVLLNQPAGEEQLVLASEREPNGITRGVIAMAVSDDGAAISLRVAPGADAASSEQLASGTLLVVVGGPELANDQIWWQVSDQEREGWCNAESLVLVSR